MNEAAESLGCSRMGRIWKIIVPLVMPTLLASSMLVFMRVFADFGTPMLIGERYKTSPSLFTTSSWEKYRGMTASRQPSAAS